MPMNNLIEVDGTYSKTSESLCKYYWDEQALNNAGAIIDFPADNDNSTSFKSKQQLTGQTENNGKKDVEKMVSLKYGSTGQTGNNRKKLLE